MFNFFKKKRDLYWKKAPKNWDKAKALSVGYDNVEPLADPDDGVTVAHASCYAIIAHLGKIAHEKNNKLRVLDFGGGLGNVYFAAREFLPHVEFEWVIVEREKIVNFGKGHISFARDKSLKFATEISNEKFDVTILSGVLQYLEHWAIPLINIIEKEPDYILLDRTLTFSSSKDKQQILTIQHCPNGSSYPCWILNQNDIEEELIKWDYEKEDEFFSSTDRTQEAAGVRVQFIGGLWKKQY